MLSGIALSSVVVLASLTSRVNAHGYLEQPKPSWKDGANVNWVTLIDNYWDIGSGGDQCGAFKKMAAEKGMSVKDVALDMVKGQKCGNTLENGTPQPIPSDGKVKWLGNGGGGLTHVGPCEIYLDDKMVLHGDNCEDEFKGGAEGSSQTSDMTVDFSSCNGKCMLTIYWVVFQNAQWQTYINCVPLEGSDGGSTTQTQGSQTSSQSTETSTKQGSAEGQDNGKSPTTEAPSPEQKSDKTPSTDQKTTEAPSSEQQSNQTPSSNQQNQSPSDQKTTEAPSTHQDEEEKKNNQDQQQNQAPSPQQGQQD